jgi:hypothetical protein
MKRINVIAGILSATVLAASLFAMQRLPGRKLPERNDSIDPLPTPLQTPASEEVSNTSKDEASPAQRRELLFSRLKVEEAERQAKGDAKEEDAIRAQERVFTDAESWRAFWSPYKTGKVPEVDFKTQHVAAVFLGPKPNPGFGVEIRKITHDPLKRLTVIHVLELLPDPRKMYAGLVVYPADIVVFPATPGQVRFEMARRVRGE